MIGRVFGRLTVNKFSHREHYNKFWSCTCKCGKTDVVVFQTYLTTGTRKSCGCLWNENHDVIASKLRTHGMTGTRFYGIWKGINGRCYCKSNRAYIHYGKLGVTSWWKDSFLKFKDDMYADYKQHVARYGEKNTSIDRIDPYGDYTKDNCRWATNTQQANNKRR